MTGLVSVVVVAVVAMAVCVLALPASLMTDVKQAEMTHARLTNKGNSTMYYLGGYKIKCYIYLLEPLYYCTINSYF